MFKRSAAGGKAVGAGRAGVGKFPKGPCEVGVGVKQAAPQNVALGLGEGVRLGSVVGGLTGVGRGRTVHEMSKAAVRNPPRQIDPHRIETLCSHVVITPTQEAKFVARENYSMFTWGAFERTATQNVLFLIYFTDMTVPPVRRTRSSGVSGKTACGVPAAAQISE